MTFVSTIAFTLNAKGGQNDGESETFVAHSLRARWGGGEDGTVNPQACVGVRRLTPRECERLQSFPDDWTLYDDRGKEIADGPRYRMIGNSVVVTCLEWIARRIKEFG